MEPISLGGWNPLDSRDPWEVQGDISLSRYSIGPANVNPEADVTLPPEILDGPPPTLSFLNDSVHGDAWNVMQGQYDTSKSKSAKDSSPESSEMISALKRVVESGSGAADKNEPIDTSTSSSSSHSETTRPEEPRPSPANLVGWKILYCRECFIRKELSISEMAAMNKERMLLPQEWECDFCLSRSSRMKASSSLRWTKLQESALFAFLRATPKLSPSRSAAYFRSASKAVKGKSLEEIKEYFAMVLRKVNNVRKLMSDQVKVIKEWTEEARLAVLSFHQLMSRTKENRRAVPNLYDEVGRNTLVKDLESEIAACREASKPKTAAASSPTGGSHAVVDLTPTPKRVSGASSITTNSPGPGKRKVVASKREKLRSKSKKTSYTIKLVPMDKSAKQKVINAGYTPKIEIRVSGSKTMSELFDHMMRKWKNAILASEEELRFVPMGDRVHPGWGGDDISVSIANLMNILGAGIAMAANGALTLEYKWIRVARSQSAPEEDYLLPASGLPVLPTESKEHSPQQERQDTSLNVDDLLLSRKPSPQQTKNSGNPPPSPALVVPAENTLDALFGEATCEAITAAALAPTASHSGDAAMSSHQDLPLDIATEIQLAEVESPSLKRKSAYMTPDQPLPSEGPRECSSPNVDSILSGGQNKKRRKRITPELISTSCPISKPVSSFAHIFTS